jgi:hypothetical protein
VQAAQCHRQAVGPFVLVSGPCAPASYWLNDASHETLIRQPAWQLGGEQAGASQLHAAPVLALCSSSPHALQLTILLDALDEGDPLEEQLGAADGRATGVRACANRVFRLLATQLRELPENVRFVLTTRPDAVGGSVLPALDAVFRDAGGVQHMQLSQLSRSPAGLATEAAGAAKPSGQVLVLQAVVAGCSGSLGSSAGGEESAPGGGGGLQQLYAAYSRVFDAAGQKADAPRAAEEPERLLAGVKLLVDVLLAAREPLPLSLLQSLGLDAALLRRLPGWGCLFFVQEHRVYLLREWGRL